MNTTRCLPLDPGTVVAFPRSCYNYPDDYAHREALLLRRRDRPGHQRHPIYRRGGGHEEDRDALRALLEKIEREAGKRTPSWHRTKATVKAAYLERVLASPLLVGKVFYAVRKDTTSYRDETIQTIARAIQAAKTSTRYKASIFIDGLTRPEFRDVGPALRRIGVAREKVRGVRDESDALIRLADAIAGLVRENLEGIAYAQKFYRLGRRNDVLQLVE